MILLRLKKADQNADKVDRQMKPYRKKLELIESLIRAAKAKEAQGELLEWHKKGIEPQALSAAAQLATRANVPELALKMLHPVVYPTSKHFIRKSEPSDLAQYGLALLWVGAVAEAKRILSPILPEEVPEVTLYKALLHVKEWEYAEAIPLIKQYLQTKDLEVYQVLRAKINLASALIYEAKLAEAKTNLAEVLEESSARRLDLFYSIALRLLGNLEIRRKNLDAALANFKRSEEILNPFGGIELYFTQKWIGIAELLSSEGDGEKKARLLQLREEALKWNHFESQRDIDFHMAVVFKDRALASHLYFGTPFESFRKRIVAECQLTQLPGSYSWALGKGKKPEIVHISEQQETRSGQVLKAGQSKHRLYKVLTSDFYRAFSVAALYEQIFPGEYYSPETSRGRVHLVVRKLRDWFKENKIPLNIQQTEGSYSLTATGACHIIVRNPIQDVAAELARLALIQERLGVEFARKQAETVLGTERTATAKTIQSGIEQGLLEKIGSGATTRYRFTKTFMDKKAA